jgi:hypothetical protein
MYLMELQLIYETIPAHFPPSQIELRANLLKNPRRKFEPPIVRNTATVLCEDIPGELLNATEACI